MNLLHLSSTSLLSKKPPIVPLYLFPKQSVPLLQIFIHPFCDILICNPFIYIHQLFNCTQDIIVFTFCFHSSTFSGDSASKLPFSHHPPSLHLQPTILFPFPRLILTEFNTSVVASIDAAFRSPEPHFVPSLSNSIES